MKISKILPYWGSGIPAVLPFFDGVTNIVAAGDSITVGQAATAPYTTNGYIYQLRTAKGIATITNGAVGGRGVWRMAKELFSGTLTTYDRDISFLSVMAGLNDMKRGGSNAKTFNKIESCYKAYMVKHLFNNTIYPSEAGVTKVGGGHANFSDATANLIGGASNSGAGKQMQYTTVAGSYWEYAFTGKYIGLILMGLDGVVFSGWGIADIYIDGVLVDSVDLSNRYDGISDGAYDNGRGPVGWYKLDLSDGPHTIRITARSAANIVLNFISYNADPSENYKAVFCEIPYNTPAGYALVPNSGSIALSDQASTIIENIVTDVRSYGFNFRYFRTNDYLSLITGIDPDGVHPNQAGHSQIASGLAAELV